MNSLARAARKSALVAVCGLALTAAPAGAQTVTEFTIPTARSFPEGIVAGPDGALWFTEGFVNKIGRITTGGMVTEFTLPTARGNPNPRRIAAGPDGALWFTGASTIGRITTGGTVTEFTVPTANSFPGFGIAAGPDGALWFTEGAADKIGAPRVIGGDR